ncbi:MAG: alpha/beta fold hydrolase [Hymenobacter sp.]|nr:alpha/beta fold hydrolase [Hymenobacter sp.]
MTTHQLALGNNTLSYLAAGAGPGIIFLHGAGTNAATNWTAVLEQLAPTNRVLALNLPGAAETTWADDTVTLPQLQEAVLTVAAAEGLETFGLVGYSAGAMVALYLAGSVPARVTRLVALAPWLTDDARTRFFFGFWGDLLATDPALFARFNALTSLSQTTQLQLDAATFAGMAAQASFSPDLLKLIRLNQSLTVEPVLAAITAFTLLVAFTDDQVCPPAYARQIAGRVTGSTLLELAAGHAGPWEAAARLQPAIVDFFAR